MAIKTYHLIALEKSGVFWQDRVDGRWYSTFPQDVDLTEHLCAAGMFEH